MTDVNWCMTVDGYTNNRLINFLLNCKQALDFLLFACMCLESSVLLLTVNYLRWRATLYTAVCQCYFDLKVPVRAEAFANRGLAT